jgi:hypothetical protein
MEEVMAKIDQKNIAGNIYSLARIDQTFTHKKTY